MGHMRVAMCEALKNLFYRILDVSTIQRIWSIATKHNKAGYSSCIIVFVMGHMGVWSCLKCSKLQSILSGSTAKGIRTVQSPKAGYDFMQYLLLLWDTGV